MTSLTYTVSCNINVYDWQKTILYRQQYKCFQTETKVIIFQVWDHVPVSGQRVGKDP